MPGPSLKHGAARSQPREERGIYRFNVVRKTARPDLTPRPIVSAVAAYLQHVIDHNHDFLEDLPSDVHCVACGQPMTCDIDGAFESGADTVTAFVLMTKFGAPPEKIVVFGVCRRCAKRKDDAALMKATAKRFDPGARRVEPAHLHHETGRA